LTHPGNKDAAAGRRRNPITQPAEDGAAEIQFPGWHALGRWRDTVATGKSITLVGKLGDEVDFSTLPLGLRTVPMAVAMGAVADFPDVGFESCGSRGEEANEPAMGHRYVSVSTLGGSMLDQNYALPESGKWLLWGTVVTHAEDQLRHRVAWALSQIWVIGDGGGNLFFTDKTEAWAAFYDILLTHAFGNYRDIMREVSASPLMGAFLTMAGNVAFANGGRCTATANQISFGRPCCWSIRSVLQGMAVLPSPSTTLIHDPPQPPKTRSPRHKNHTAQPPAATKNILQLAPPLVPPSQRCY
jgi:hypothetical protein